MLHVGRNRHCHLTLVCKRHNVLATLLCFQATNLKRCVQVAIDQRLLQGQSEGLNRRKAFLSFFGQCAQDNGINRRCKLSVVLTGRRWRDGEVLVHDLLRTPLKGELTSQQLIGHDSEGILIGCCHGFATPLFWSHINGGATYTLVRQRGCREDFGNAEVNEEQVRVCRSIWINAHKEVGGLDILVNDLLVMSMLEHRRCLCDESAHILQRQ